MRVFGAILFGLGCGVAVSSASGVDLLWPGVIAVAVGLGLLMAGARTEPATLDGTRPEGDRRRPTLAGLGTRVEQILQLAEEQANDHRAEARREAEAILAAAHAEAAEIRAQAGERPTPTGDT
jgi:hypothetical protein